MEAVDVGFYSRVDVDAAPLRGLLLTLSGQSGREQLARRSQAPRM